MALGQLCGPLSKESAADGAGNLLSRGPGQIVDALCDQGPTWGMKMKSLTTHPALQAAGAHGALLEDGGGEAALAEGGERAQRVVAHDDDGLGEVDLRGGGLQSEDPSLGL